MNDNSASQDDSSTANQGDCTADPACPCQLGTLDAVGQAFVRLRAQVELHQVLASVDDPTVVDRERVTRQARLEAGAIYASLQASDDRLTEGPGANYLGWFTGNLEDVRFGRHLIVELRRTHPTALATEEMFYREICWRTGTTPDESLSPIERCVSVGHTCAALRQANLALARAVCSEDIQAFLAHRLEACATLMGLSSVPAGEDPCGEMMIDVAERLATSLQKIDVPGEAYDRILEGSLRCWLFGRLFMAGFATARQEIEATEPSMPPVLDAHVLKAVHSAAALNPDLFTRLETAEGEELVRARADALVVARQRAKAFLMLECAKFRALKSVEKKVHQTLSFDRPVGVSLSLAGLKRALAVVAVPTDLQEQDAAFYDALVANAKDTFLSRVLAQIASVRSLDLQKNVSLRAALFTEILARTEQLQADAPARIVAIASAIQLPALSAAPMPDEVSAFCQAFGQQLQAAKTASERALDSACRIEFERCVALAFVTLHPETIRSFAAVSDIVYNWVDEQLVAASAEARGTGDEVRWAQLEGAIKLNRALLESVDVARTARTARVAEVFADYFATRHEELIAWPERLFAYWPHSSRAMREAVYEGLRRRCQLVVDALPSTGVVDAEAICALIDRETIAFLGNLTCVPPARFEPFTGNPAPLMLLSVFTEDFDHALAYLAVVAKTNPKALDALDVTKLRADLAMRLGTPIPPAESLDAAFAKFVAGSRA